MKANKAYYALKLSMLFFAAAFNVGLRLSSRPCKEMSPIPSAMLQPPVLESKGTKLRGILLLNRKVVVESMLVWVKVSTH